MRSLVAALLAATALTSGARGDEVKTATWFADHPEARAKVNALCKDNPGQAKHEPNCDNAFQGNVIAATRAAQAHPDGIMGVTKFQTTDAFWRDPAHAQMRDFWARQCKTAETRHVSQAMLDGMSCGPIEASMK
jgi:hypothetical protein